MARADRVAALGALLFAAGEPVARERLAALLACTAEELEAALRELAERAAALGLMLLAHGEAVQLATAPEHGPLIAQLFGGETGRLSPAALETLAIIAYLQPVTRAEIETVRGVDSSAALQTLLAYGLVERQGWPPLDRDRSLRNAPRRGEASPAPSERRAVSLAATASHRIPSPLPRGDRNSTSTIGDGVVRRPCGPDGSGSA
jgi:segregation and condensation protein B